jgi:hypothetical protein
MIGTLIPLCQAFTEIILSILGFESIALVFVGYAMIVAAALGGFVRYGGCMPSYSLPRVLFFGMWIITMMVVGMAGWMIWYFNERTCDAWIALTIWLVLVLAMSIWPITLFVVSSIPLTFLTFVVSALLTIAFGVWTSYAHFSVIVLLLSIYVLVFLIYMIIWSFFFWRYYGKLWKKQTLRGLIEDISSLAVKWSPDYGNEVKNSSYKSNVIL